MFLAFRLRQAWRANEIPLPRLYYWMIRSGILYFLYCLIYIIVGINFLNSYDNDTESHYTHDLAIVYLTSGIIAGLSGTAKVVNFNVRTIPMSMVSALLGVIFSAWTIFKFIYILTILPSGGIGTVIVMVFIGLIIASTACTSVYIQYVIIKRLKAGENPYDVDNRLRNDLIPPQAQRSDAPIAAVHQTYPPVATAVPVSSTVPPVNPTAPSKV